MGSKKKHYFGKGGKVFGPYSDEKVEQFRLSGEILNFTFYWEETKEEWRLIEPKPPKPGSDRPLPRRGTDAQLEDADAVCHDFSSLVEGKLQNVTDLGCDLVSHDREEPPLGLNAVLVLNVLNPAGDKAANVKAVVHDLTHHEQGWTYHIRWGHRPSF